MFRCMNESHSLEVVDFPPFLLLITTASLRPTWDPDMRTSFFKAFHCGRKWIIQNLNVCTLKTSKLLPSLRWGLVWYLRGYLEKWLYKHLSESCHFCHKWRGILNEHWNYILILLSFVFVMEERFCQYWNIWCWAIVVYFRIMSLADCKQRKSVKEWLQNVPSRFSWFCLQFFWRAK